MARIGSHGLTGTALVTDSTGIAAQLGALNFECGIIAGDPTGPVAERVQGDPYFPVNNGQLCIKGWTSHSLLRHQ